MQKEKWKTMDVILVILAIFFTCFCDCDDYYLHKNRRNSGYLMYLRV